ncbi:hypothetical protein [Catellatospora sp. NPDC049609]|uniref:hypothetical protein n=1 Tax=Catellatospora sp. NPDC049609 TaxID=3155505 RepID=UPI003420D8CB
MIPAALTRQTRPRQPRHTAAAHGLDRHSVLNRGWLAGCGATRAAHADACCRPMSLMPR